MTHQQLLLPGWLEGDPQRSRFPVAKELIPRLFGPTRNALWSYPPTPAHLNVEGMDREKVRPMPETPQPTVTSGSEQRRREVVLICDFIDVARPLEVLETDFGADGRWLAPLANEAQHDVTTLFTRVGPAWAPEWLGREVSVAVGGRRARGDGVAVSIRWEAVEAERLFPVLDGDLELAPLGSDDCRLILAASYIPPLGTLGRALDRALLHRVAESTVRAFLSKLAEHLEHAVGTPT